MKSRILLIIIELITLFVSCGKNDSNPTGPSNTSYADTDIVGSWSGEAKNSSNTLSMNLTVDSVGKVSGSGVSSSWSIDSSGKITGGGSFSFISGSRLTVAGAGWTLQLNSNKKDITGKYNVAYSTLNDMDVTLTKQ